MLPEWGEEVRRLLRDYTGHRLDAVRSGDVTEGIRRSENIQQQMWTEAETVAQKNLNSIVVGLFSFRSRWCYCAKIIMAVAVAFLLVVSAFHLPVALVPGHDRLRQALRLVAAAAAAAVVAVVAEAADQERPASSLVGRALHPLALHHLGALSADAILVVHLREVGPAQLHPSAPACQTVLVDPDPAVDFVEAHFALHLAAHRAVVVAGDAVAAAATAHLPKPTAVLLSQLLLVRLPHVASAIARQVVLGLGRVPAAMVKRLRAAPMAGLSPQDELFHRVDLLGLAKATRVLHLLLAFLLLRAEAAHRA